MTTSLHPNNSNDPSRPDAPLPPAKDLQHTSGNTTQSIEIQDKEDLQKQIPITKGKQRTLNILKVLIAIYAIPIAYYNWRLIRACFEYGMNEGMAFAFIFLYPYVLVASPFLLIFGLLHISWKPPEKWYKYIIPFSPLLISWLLNLTWWFAIATS